MKTTPFTLGDGTIEAIPAFLAEIIDKINETMSRQTLGFVISRADFQVPFGDQWATYAVMFRLTKTAVDSSYGVLIQGPLQAEIAVLADEHLFAWMEKIRAKDPTIQGQYINREQEIFVTP